MMHREKSVVRAENRGLQSPTRRSVSMQSLPVTTLIVTVAVAILGGLEEATAQNIALPQDIADKFGAKCLNGQAPTYEITRNVSETRWILFLEGT